MRLVIHNRQGATASGLRRYRGEGIFSSIGRKLFSSGLKKVINVASKANLPQKIAEVVVNGAKSGGEKLGTLAGEKLTQTIIKKTKRKRPLPINPLIDDEEEESRNSKHSKLDIDRLINGSGIIIE